MVQWSFNEAAKKRTDAAECRRYSRPRPADDRSPSDEYFSLRRCCYYYFRGYSAMRRGEAPRRADGHLSRYSASTPEMNPTGASADPVMPRPEKDVAAMHHPTNRITVSSVSCSCCCRPGSSFDSPHFPCRRHRRSR